MVARPAPPLDLPAVSPLGIAACMAAFALAVRLLLLSGFGGTDDVTYALRGVEVAHGIWRSGTHITELRYGVNLPIALFASVFGTGTLSLAGWSLLSSVFEVGLVAWFASVVWSRGAGLAAGFVLAVMPLHIMLGGRPLADAPLGMFITLAFVCLASAERTGSRSGYLAAGLACGACWWIKPTVAMPLYLAMLPYVALVRRLDRRWLYMVAGCALMIAAEFAFLGVISNDPFSTVKSLLPFLASHQQYRGDPLWGSNSPWYYFHRMFLDGREMWLVPFVAAGGAAVLARRLGAAPRRAGPDSAAADRFVLFWAATLLGMFSFFVFSLHPLRFIPKQENYASIFLAPLALLAAAALVRLPGMARVVLLVVLAAGGLTLAGIEQQSHRQKHSRMVQALEFARAEPAATVLVSAQTATLGRLQALASPAAQPPGLAPLATVDRFVGASADTTRPLYLVLEPSSPERTDSVLWTKITRLTECARPLRELRTESGGAGVAALRLVAWLQPKLPAVVGRQMSFVDPLLDPPAARVLSVSAACRMSLPGDGVR